MNNTEKLKFQPSAMFGQLQSLYKRVDDVKGGTDAMRNAGLLYLPKGPAEPLANYSQRLNRSIASPIYWRTIEKGVGKAFTKGLQVDNLPPELEVIKDNADGAGTSLETFTKGVLKDAIHFGVTYLLVDYPVLTPNATLADERAAGAAPYFVNIKPTFVLDLRTAFIQNGVQPVYFRFLESVTEFDDEYNENTINQVKEFIRINSDEGSFVRYNIYRIDDNDQQYLYDSNDLFNMPNIPLVPIYGNKTSQFIGEPTLMELAMQSIDYWSLHSGYQNILSTCGTPLILVKGLSSTTTEDEDGNPSEFILSANTAYFLEADGDIRLAESGGGSAKILQDALDRLESQMYASGLELIAANNSTSKATQAETATGRIIDAADANSILKSIVTDLTWSLFHAIMLAGDMVDVDASGTTVDIDTAFSVGTAIEFADLMQLFDKGILTADEVMDELKVKGSFQSESIINRKVFNATPQSNVETVVDDNSKDTDVQFQ